MNNSLLDGYTILMLPILQCNDGFLQALYKHHVHGKLNTTMLISRNISSFRQQQYSTRIGLLRYNLVMLRCNDHGRHRPLKLFVYCARLIVSYDMEYRTGKFAT